MGVFDFPAFLELPSPLPNHLDDVSFISVQYFPGCSGYIATGLCWTLGEPRLDASSSTAKRIVELTDGSPDNHSVLINGV